MLAVLPPFQVGDKSYWGVLVEPLPLELLAPCFLCLLPLVLPEEVPPVAEVPVVSPLAPAVEPLPEGEVEFVAEAPDCPLAAPVLASVPRPSVLLVLLPLVLLVPLLSAPCAPGVFWLLAVPVPPLLGVLPLLSLLLQPTANASATVSIAVQKSFIMRNSSGLDFANEMFDGQARWLSSR